MVTAVAVVPPPEDTASPIPMAVLGEVELKEEVAVDVPDW